MRLFLIVLVGSALGTALALLAMWQFQAEIEISLHGWIAFGLGVFFSFLVGAGLMTLMFVSARRGYDDRIEMDRDEEQ